MIDQKSLNILRLAYEEKISLKYQEEAKRVSYNPNSEEYNLIKKGLENGVLGVEE